MCHGLPNAPRAAGTIPLPRRGQAHDTPIIPENARYNVQNPIYLGGDGLTYTLTRGTGNSGYRTGHDPAAPRSRGQHASVSGGGVRGNATGGEAGPSDGWVGVVDPELRWKVWIVFAVEKLASITCIAVEIATLGVCFDDYVSGVGEPSLESTEVAELMDYEANQTYDIVRFVLIFGLVVEVVSAVVLSRIYRSPLDIKSVHKIPPDDLRSCGGNMMVFFLAPFSWAVIYLIGGIASVMYGIHASCGGNGGEGLDVYLAVSGFLMELVGFGLLVTSLVTLCFSFGSPSRCTDGCCATARRGVSKRILSKGAVFELFWILQGVVWSYRTGDPTMMILTVMIVSLALAVVFTGGKVAVHYIFPQTTSSK